VESGSVDGGMRDVDGFVVVVAGRAGVCVMILGCAFTNGGKGGKGGMVCRAVDGVGVVDGGLVVAVAPGRAGVCVLISGCAFTNGGKGGKGGMVCGAVDGEDPELTPCRAGVALFGCAVDGAKGEVLCGVDCAIGVVHCASVVVVAPGRGCDNESDDCAVVGDGTIDLSLGRVVSVACVTDAEPLGFGTLASVCDGGVYCTVFVVTDVALL
jgi:hypothetical protein